MALPPVTQERRRFLRRDFPSRLAINLLRSHAPVSADTINVSQGGLRLRLQETLEVRSLVRLQFTPQMGGGGRSARALECTGRVAWVIQRLDLRDIPPFLYDVGIQFVDPPPALRQLLARRGGQMSAPKDRSTRGRVLEPFALRGRRFVPRLERQANHPLRWHLVVTVDDVPCFSGHFPTEHLAMAAWNRFKRQQTKR